MKNGEIKNPVEKRARAQIEIQRMQNKTTLLLNRLTAEMGRSMFVPEAVLVKRLGLKIGEGKHPTYRMRQAFVQLQKKGLVTYKRSAHGWSAQLTALGKKHSKQLELFEKIDLKKPRKWDGSWRIVIFDIWERRRPVRDRLRYMLNKAGFYKVQNSVWVYPYDCEELIAFLRAEMKLGRGVLYLVAEGIEYDDYLRSHFDLL